jgi:hypothetical protein
MVNLENYYTTLQRAMKLTRYMKDTCPRFYDTGICNRLKIRKPI